MNNKNLIKRGLQVAPLLFPYEVNIVLIDFIPMLLTSGIFLIQIVNKNMYLKLIFIVKILLKCVFPKVEFLKFKTDSDIHYPSERGEINVTTLD